MYSRVLLIRKKSFSELIFPVYRLSEYVPDLSKKSKLKILMTRNVIAHIFVEEPANAYAFVEAEESRDIRLSIL